MSVVLVSARLRMMTMNHDYAEDVYREYTENIARYMYLTPGNRQDNTDRVAQYIDENTAGTHLHLAILDSDGFIGYCAIYGNDSLTPRLSLWISESHRGLGYGKEIVDSLIDYITARSEYEYIVYPVDINNTTSIKIITQFHPVIGATYDLVTKNNTTLHIVEYRIQNPNHTLRTN
jgi:[ribosomal protein S5]-alanine N-acetyltransferase